MSADNTEALSAILKNHEYPHADVKDRCAVYIIMDQEEGVVADLDMNPVFAEDVYEAALAGHLKVVDAVEDGVMIINPHIAVDLDGRIGIMLQPSDTPVWIEKRDSEEHIFD